MNDIANSPLWLYGLAVVLGLVLIGAVIVILRVIIKEKKRK